MKKIILLIISVLTIVTLVACGATTSKKEPKAKGKKMTLAFATNPTTGYDWTFKFEEGDDKGKIFLENLENEFPKGTGLVGQGGFRIYNFKATAPGPQKLTFTYERPWEGGEKAYDVVYELNVDSDLNIEWLDKQKGIIESEEKVDFFPDPIFA